MARARETQRGRREGSLIGDDILMITRDEGIIGVRPEGGLKDLLQRSSTEESPGGIQGPGVMDLDRHEESHHRRAWYTPQANGRWCPWMQLYGSSSGDKEITGRAKLKITLEVPL